MAKFGIGKTAVDVKVTACFDGSEHFVVVKDSVSITRSANEPSVLSCTILRDDTFSIQVGDAIEVFIDGEHHAFFGYVEEATYERQWADITAYDSLHFLQINETTQFIYEEMTATQVLTQIIRDNQLPEGQFLEDSIYVIPYRIEQNSKYLDVIRTALDLTIENTGEHFFVWDNAGGICISSEKSLADASYIRLSAGFIEDYSFKISLDGVYTASKVTNGVAQEGEEARELEEFFAQDNELMNRYGFRQKSDTLNEGEDGQGKADQLLAANSHIDRKVSVSKAQGDITVRGGTPILVDFFTNDRCEYIRGWFRVNSVTHNIEHAYHTMELDIEQITEITDWDNNCPDFSFVQEG